MSIERGINCRIVNIFGIFIFKRTIDIFIFFGIIITERAITAQSCKGHGIIYEAY